MWIAIVLAAWAVLALAVAIVIGKSVKQADIEAEVERFREELSALG